MPGIRKENCPESVIQRVAKCLHTGPMEIDCLKSVWPSSTLLLLLVPCSAHICKVHPSIILSTSGLTDHCSTAAAYDGLNGVHGKAGWQWVYQKTFDGSTSDLTTGLAFYHRWNHIRWRHYPSDILLSRRSGPTEERLGLYRGGMIYLPLAVMTNNDRKSNWPVTEIRRKAESSRGDLRGNRDEHSAFGLQRDHRLISCLG